MPGVFRVRAMYPPRRKLRVQLFPAGVDGTGSGSASFNFTAAAGGASDGTGSGSVSFNFTAAAGGAADGIGSGSASFNFTAAGVATGVATLARSGFIGLKRDRVMVGQRHDRVWVAHSNSKRGDP